MGQPDALLEIQDQKKDGVAVAEKVTSSEY